MMISGYSWHNSEKPMTKQGREIEAVNSGQEDKCPYLGLPEDAYSVQDYPSIYNVCHHVVPTAVPKLSHQVKSCLTPGFSHCPVFSADPDQKMPLELAMRFNPKVSRQLGWGGLGLAAVIGLLVLFLLVSRPWKTAPISSPSPLPAPTSTNIPFLFIRDASATPENTAAAPAPTPTAEPTSTPTPVATRTPHTLDVVIGSQDQFIVHRVSSGESIQLYATLHKTNPNVIKSVNYNLVVPIWVDSIIVIPLNRTDPGDLPAFEPYGIADEGMTLRDIANKFGVDLDTLARYNDLLPDDILVPGEWVLIPRERTYWYRY